MSAHASPNIITDGLAFMYDTGSGKSYKGEPAENLWDSMLNTQALRSHTKHYWDGYKWLENATYSNPGVEGPKGTYLGLVFKHTSGAINSVWSGNSYGYMLRDIVCTSGATFTQSCWIYTSEDCDVTAIPSVIEGESGGESAVTGYPASYDLTNKGTWQVTAKKAISDGNTRFIPLYPRKNGVTDGSFTGFFMWSLPQVVAGSHVVQPIQPGVTRSATAGLLDRTNNSTINLSNVSFDSDAQITLDGTDDYIDLGSDVSISPDNQGWTTEYWFNTNSASTLQHFNSAENDEFNANWLAILSSKLAVWNRNPGYWKYGSTQFSSNTWYQAVFICDAGGTNMRFYVNGEAEGGDHVGNVWTASYSSLDVRYIGKYEYNGGHSRYFNGEINAVKIYDRALTSAEVLQNFNATKDRFGL